MASLTNNPAVMDMSHLSFTRPQFTKLAKSIRSSIAEKVVAYNKEHFGDNNTSVDKFRFQPNLTIIQVGSRPDSSAYVKSKLKAAASSNIKSNLLKFDENISQDDLVDEIQRLNNDPKTHGILIQLPLPKHIDETLIITMLVNYPREVVFHSSSHVL